MGERGTGHEESAALDYIEELTRAMFGVLVRLD
jgi:hypothetical protein